MADEHELTQLDVVERALGRACPWATQQRLELAAEIFLKRIAEEDVEEQPVFTAEMLVNAQKLGHQLAQTLGPAPSTPGSPVLPPSVGVQFVVGELPTGGFPYWSEEGTPWRSFGGSV